MVNSGCTHSLHIDGVPDGASCTGASIDTLNLDLHIGGGYTPLLSDADLAEVRFWGMARSADEINTHMRKSLVVSAYSQSTLRGYWRFADSSNLELDSSLWNGAYTPTFNNANDHGRSGAPAAGDWVGTVSFPALPSPTYSLVGNGECSCDNVNIYNRQFAPSGYSTTSEAESFCSSHSGCTGFTFTESVVDFIWRGSGFSHSGLCGDGPPTDVRSRPDYSVVMCYRKYTLSPPPLPSPQPPSPPPVAPPVWTAVTSATASVVSATCTGGQCSGDQMTNAGNVLTGGTTTFHVNTNDVRKEHVYVIDLGSSIALAGVSFTGTSSGCHCTNTCCHNDNWFRVWASSSSSGSWTELAEGDPGPGAPNGPGPEHCNYLDDGCSFDVTGQSSIAARYIKWMVYSQCTACSNSDSVTAMRVASRPTPPSPPPFPPPPQVTSVSP